MEASLDLPTALLFLERLLAGRTAACACLDDRLHIQLAWPGLTNFVEYKVSDVTGEYLPDVFIEFFGSEPALQAVWRGEQPAFRLTPVAREQPDGNTRYLSFEVTRMESENCKMGLLLLVEDITATSELEQHLIQDRNDMRLLRAELSRANTELQYLSRFKSNMLAMAAHDLRTPLSVILSYLEMLRTDIQRGRQLDTLLEMLDWMLVSARRLSKLITGLLDREQAEQGRLVLQPERCELRGLVRQVIQMRLDALQRLDLEPSPDAIYVMADPARLEQVFYNLIDNALKYTPSDKRVTITISRQEDWACVRVSDQGPGLTLPQIAGLFQMYHRADDAHQKSAPGSGLGLFIVKALVEAHGGRVEVDSQVGHGATFSVYLPGCETTT